MKINILLPYKEKFDFNKSSSVSITIKNNLIHTRFLKDIKVFGQDVEKPLFSNNFVGIKYSYLSLKSKNNYLAVEMLKEITKENDSNQIIEVHNRPYLINQIEKKTKIPISIFFHNDPQTMKGSKSIKDRENILKKCAAVFCVSNYIKKKFIEGVSSNKGKVHVLYNGVEKNFEEFPTKRKEILFVGRLVPEKGVHFYVNVAKIIAPAYKDWNFGLIGSYRLGDKKNKNSYASKIIKEFTNIGPRAKFYGFQNQEFVKEKMKTASIIVIPSIWAEPFGLVAAEAMSNGICIIASKVGGIPEIIKNNGILIEKINDLKLHKCILEVIKNDKTRLCYQKKAWKNFTLSSVTSSKKLDNYRKKIFKNYF